LAHADHVSRSPSIRTRTNGTMTTIAYTALRPRSMPRTDWHLGQFHFDHA
jgi:hypothetical protein